jgi:predicted polyphosphate/ATP-dependent NAD kinase
MTSPTVGIIANPVSGKDIRRLIALGSTFDNNEKANIVRRVLLGLEAMGVERVLYMPDTYAIVARAIEPLRLRLSVNALPMPVLGEASDTLEAARRLADLGVGCIVTLGGDGTNRMVAKGCGETPLVPISTGTNNVFPQMIEGTIAGIAAGLVATGQAGTSAIVQKPRLDIFIGSDWHDLALIDVVASPLAFVGARAIWDTRHVSEVVLSRVSCADIGMCGLGGLLFPGELGNNRGVHIVVGQGDRHVLAPIAPGLMRDIPIAGARLLAPDESVHLHPDAKTLALDGEREIELVGPSTPIEVRFNPAGPRVVSIETAIRTGAARGAFVRLNCEPAT